MSSNTRRSKYRQIRKTQEGRVEENMGGIIVIGKGGSESERSFQCFGTMGTLSKSDCGGKSASRSRGVWWRDGETERPVEFTMIKAFIGEGEHWNRFRSNKTCSSSLSSIFHDHVLIFREDEG